MKKPEKLKKENSLHTIAKGGFIALAGLFIGKIIGYIYTIFASKLGTNDYGLLGLALAIVSFIIVISQLGLDQGILRYVSYYNAKNNKAKVKGALYFSLKLSFLVSLLLGSLVFIFSNFISITIFHKPDLAGILRIVSFTIPLTTVSFILLSALRAFKRIEYDVSIKEIAEKSVRLIAFLALFYLGFGVFGAALSFVISSIVMILLAFYFLLKVYKFNDKTPVQYYNKEILLYSFPLLLSGIMLVVIAWTDILMIGYFRTASEVGIYNAALTTASLMFILPIAIISLFLPVVVELYGKKKVKEISQVFKRTSKWIFLTNLPIMLILFVFSEKILDIIFGSSYSGGSFALSILSLGYMIYAISFTSSNILSMLKKTKLIFYVSLTFALSNVVLNYFLILIYGINGAAIATSLSFLIGGTVYSVLSYRKMRLQPISVDFFKILLSGIISILIVYQIRKFLPVDLGLFVTFFLFTIFILIYMLLIFLIKAIDKKDWDIINLFRNKIKIASNYIISS